MLLYLQRTSAHRAHRNRPHEFLINSDFYRTAIKKIMNVFWTSVEYKYQSDDLLRGGFVYAFVKANDAVSAYERIRDVMISKHLTPISWDFICPYDVETEWASEEESIHYKELYKKALHYNQCVFDEFYAYEK